MRGRMAVWPVSDLAGGAGAAWHKTRGRPVSWSSAAATPPRRRPSFAARRPRPAAPVAGLAPQRWQVVAGKRLWLVDLATAEVRSCSKRDASTVGLREIRCAAGELGRYSRTFGRNFNPWRRAAAQSSVCR